ncbi:MAG: cell division protein SepF [Frankiales bacterium]|jgi:cell division inhibitor SepF|nr:cell division protein SepF [Frankiales bacterium]
MSGTMRKLGLYLGLVEDDEDARDRRYADDAYDDEDDLVEAVPPSAPVSSRRWSTEEPAPTTALRRAPEPVGAGGMRTRGNVALDTQLRPAPLAVREDAYRITTLHPRTYNEARQIGEHFRDGTPVIMNLTEMDDVDAKRLVDFAAGLIFGLRGSIERVTAKVFLLSPEHVEVTAEDKARIAESGFFNQS